MFDAAPGQNRGLLRRGLAKMPAPGRARQASPAAKNKSPRKRLYELHSWFGFHLAVLMAIVLFTGTIATVSNEIDWLIQDDMRVVPDGEMVSWGDMENAIQNYAPAESIIYLLSMGNDHFAYRALMVDEYGRQNFIHVNQWTGEVTGETQRLTVQRVFRDLHRHLFLPFNIGLPLVASLGFILAVSLYTGLKTTRNWKTIMFRIRINKGARIMLGDAHKAAGLWGSWFILVMIVTGVWYLVEFGADKSGMISNDVERYESFPWLSAAQTADYGPVIMDSKLDEVVAAARSAYPELTVTGVVYPLMVNGVFAVSGYAGNPFVSDESNTVFLDPQSLEVVRVHKWKDFSTFFALNELADPLHFGDFGGLTTKIIWFVFGLGLTGLSVTGVLLTWKRLKTAAPSKTQFATLPVLLLSMFFCVQWYESYQPPSVPENERTLAAQKLPGNVTARVHLALDPVGAPTGLVRVTMAIPGGRPTVRTISTEIGGQARQSRVRPLGGTTQSRLEMSPDAISSASRLELVFCYPDGSQEALSWLLNEE